MGTDYFLNTFLMLLCRTLTTRKLYFSQHGKVKEQTRLIEEALRGYFSESKDGSLFIGVAGDDLVFKGRMLTGPSITGARLISFAGYLHCGGFIFNRGATAEEIERLIDLAADTRQSLASLTAAQKLLQQNRIVHIELAHLYAEQEQESAADARNVWSGRETSSGGTFSAAPVYQALFDVVSGAYDSASSDQVIDIFGAQSVSEYLLHHTRTHFCDMMQKVHYPDFDTYTVGHCVRVAALAVYAGMNMGFSDKMLLETGTAALLHDVGKAKIPGSIIHKKGALSKEEYEVMKSHPALGVEILLAHQHATELDRAAAWGHHIRYDGKGYPQQPSWAVRHPVTALLQICDVFEALTAIRPYKKAKTPHEAYLIMMADKGGFHPDMLAQFIRALGLYPPGNMVKLSDGRRGTVMSAGVRVDRPGILVTHAANGSELGDEGNQYCDLADPACINLAVRELLIEQ